MPPPRQGGGLVLRVVMLGARRPPPLWGWGHAAPPAGGRLIPAVVCFRLEICGLFPTGGMHKKIGRFPEIGSFLKSRFRSVTSVTSVIILNFGYVSVTRRAFAPFASSGHWSLSLLARRAVSAGSARGRSPASRGGVKCACGCGVVARARHRLRPHPTAHRVVRRRVARHSRRMSLVVRWRVAVGLGVGRVIAQELRAVEGGHAVVGEGTGGGQSWALVDSRWVRCCSWSCARVGLGWRSAGGSCLRSACTALGCHEGRSSGPPKRVECKPLSRVERAFTSAQRVRWSSCLCSSNHISVMIMLELHWACCTLRLLCGLRVLCSSGRRAIAMAAVAAAAAAAAACACACAGCVMWVYSTQHVCAAGRCDGVVKSFGDAVAGLKQARVAVRIAGHVRAGPAGRPEWRERSTPDLPFYADAKLFYAGIHRA
jgi:hypothetical protein